MPEAKSDIPRLRVAVRNGQWSGLGIVRVVVVEGETIEAVCNLTREISTLLFLVWSAANNTTDHIPTLLSPSLMLPLQVW